MNQMPSFDCEEGEHKSFGHERLLAVCNYDLNVNQLETDKDFKAVFQGLFRKPEADMAT